MATKSNTSSILTSSSQRWMKNTGSPFKISSMLTDIDKVLRRHQMTSFSNIRIFSSSSRIAYSLIDFRRINAFPFMRSFQAWLIKTAKRSRCTLEMMTHRMLLSRLSMVSEMSRICNHIFWKQYLGGRRPSKTVHHYKIGCICTQISFHRSEISEKASKRWLALSKMNILAQRSCTRSWMLTCW